MPGFCTIHFIYYVIVVFYIYRYTINTFSVFLCNFPLTYILPLAWPEKIGFTQNVFHLLFTASVNKVIPGICHLNKALNQINN